MVKLSVTDVTVKTMFPQLTKLASIAAILPVSTAEWTLLLSYEAYQDKVMKPDEDFYTSLSDAN